MTVLCPLCKRRCKTDREFLEHLEHKHKNDDCGCGEQKGGKIFKGLDRDSMDNFEKILLDARSKMEKVEMDMKMNAVEYGLKLGKRDMEKIPLPVREKIRGILMENDYLKGVIKGQSSQIKMMKRQVDKCIDSVGFHYVIRK
jgi:hypothetical protein